MKLNKLQNEKLYLGHTYNTNYIGKYNEKTNSLDKVLMINISGHKVELAPALHPVFITKKFEPAKLIDLNMPIDMFIFMTDPDKIEFGTELINAYDNALENIIVEPQSVSDKDVAEIIKNTIEKKTNNDKLKILQ